MRFGIFGIQAKRLFVLVDRIVDVAFFELNYPQIIVRHPATWILCNGRAPQCFGVAVGRALPPGQDTQANQNREADADYERTTFFYHPLELRQSCGSDSDRTDGG